MTGVTDILVVIISLTDYILYFQCWLLHHDHNRKTHAGRQTGVRLVCEYHGAHLLENIATWCSILVVHQGPFTTQCQLGYNI